LNQFFETNIFNLREELKAPNISQVPHYSPFRFPGGKTWFYYFAKRWMADKRSKTLIEPFAGGASIGISAAIEKWVKQVILIEIDPNIFSVWETILSDKGLDFAQQISKFDLTETSIEKQNCLTTRDLSKNALKTLIRNRTNHGGILANGSGKLKYGEAGKGILSRWYPKTLSERIQRIYYCKDRLEIINYDGISSIQEYSLNMDNIFFIDPPYTKAGKRLYDFFEIDHDKLFKTLSEIKNSFLLTYDDSSYIIDLVNKYNFQYEKVLMTTTHHKRKYELIISKDLDWLR
jgi:DNA adenine methylase